MAQIVTITNPLTGQPAQVDQLEHTAQEIDDSIGRALPGGEIDTLLAGKAPAGYGLGGVAKILTSSDDLNNIQTTGWYCYHRSNQPANVPTPEVYSAVMEVIFGYFSGQVLQRVYSTGDDNDWNLVAQRVFYGSGGWQPWEWVNPPMTLGVEYRTTERYLGKPVYAMIINCGMSEDNKIIRVTPENGLGTLIRGDVVLGGEPAFYIAGNDFSNSYSRYANVEQNGGQIEISLRQGSSYGSMQTYAIVYYTKE